MNTLIDTHAHLQIIPKKFHKAVLERAKKAGVHKIISPSCSLEHIAEGLAIADEHEGVYTSAGIHPTDLTESIERDLERVHEYAEREEKIVAIGEIGLDYYHDRFPHDLQIAFFVGQLNIAKLLDLPAILHCRAGKHVGENSKAHEDLIKVLKETDFNNAVAHCFSGTVSEARQLLDLGLMLSFTGIVTYDNEEMKAIVKATPLERIMVETDSPYITPKKFGRQKNEPAFVTEIAKAIAEIKGVSFEEVAEVTTGNAEEFFGVSCE